MLSTTIITESPHWARLTIYKGEDLVEPVPQLVDGVSGEPFDLTGMGLHLYIRPTFDYETIIAYLSPTTSPPSIIVDDAENGLITLYLDRETRVEDLPIGRFEQFLDLVFVDDDLGTLTKTIWRGPCLILPGNTSLA